MKVALWHYLAMLSVPFLISLGWGRFQLALGTCNLEDFFPSYGSKLRYAFQLKIPSYKSKFQVTSKIFQVRNFSVSIRFSKFQITSSKLRVNSSKFKALAFQFQLGSPFFLSSYLELGTFTWKMRPFFSKWNFGLNHFLKII